MIAMLPPSSLGNEVTFHCLYLLDACRVCSVDRAEIASNNKVCGFINNFKYVFYVPLNFGLGDFLFAMGVKEIEGFAKRYGKL